MVCDVYRLLYTGLELSILYFFFFKQKTAYEMRISDWSSDVCSSDLRGLLDIMLARRAARVDVDRHQSLGRVDHQITAGFQLDDGIEHPRQLILDAVTLIERDGVGILLHAACVARHQQLHKLLRGLIALVAFDEHFLRSEEHTSELQSLMRISYAVFCLKKKKNK